MCRSQNATLKTRVEPQTRRTPGLTRLNGMFFFSRCLNTHFPAAPPAVVLSDKNPLFAIPRAYEGPGPSSVAAQPANR